MTHTMTHKYIIKLNMIYLRIYLSFSVYIDTYLYE